MYLNSLPRLSLFEGGSFLIPLLALIFEIHLYQVLLLLLRAACLRYFLHVLQLDVHKLLPDLARILILILRWLALRLLFFFEGARSEIKICLVHVRSVHFHSLEGHLLCLQFAPFLTREIVFI